MQTARLEVVPRRNYPTQPYLMTDATPLPLSEGDPLWHALRDYLNRQPTPTVVIQKSDRRICLGNEAFSRFGTRSIVGTLVDSHLDWIPSTRSYSPCRFFGRWYVAVEKPLPRHIRHVDKAASEKSDLLAETDLFSIVQLQEPSHLPSIESLRTIRQMTSVLLHRFRSPLTGMQGYIELMRPSVNEQKSLTKLDRIQGRLDELFELMDQLEVLYHLPEETRADGPGKQIDLSSLVTSVRQHFPAREQDRIRGSFTEDAFSVHGRPELLEKVLTELVRNALDCDPMGITPVTISLSRDQVLRVHNQGPLIPESVSLRIFEPFVTTHATHLGIGLTRASLWTGLMGGCLYLTDNSETDGVSFSLCLPDY